MMTNYFLCRDEDEAKISKDTLVDPQPAWASPGGLSSACLLLKMNRII